ncbi:1-(5-phosphoribosyl)-5-[(5-phosphoribosylamino)methylideneamino]imidazole-4-carboxamide isomerase [soil metagenome]
MLVIPAIDLIGGRCVRLNQGDFARETRYEADPVEVARSFAEDGAQWLHIVDLDGAKRGEATTENLGRVRDIALQVCMEWPMALEFGGGVTVGRIDDIFTVGVSRVVLGSALVKNPDYAREAFRMLGKDAVAGIDCRNGKVATAGWLETSEITAVEMAQRAVEMGAQRIILTDIARDGMLTGPNLELLAEVASAVEVPIIQSGGISTLDDIKAVASIGLPNVEGVIVGKALYEKRFTLAEAIMVSGLSS